jgi:hypothetical protein
MKISTIFVRLLLFLKWTECGATKFRRFEKIIFLVEDEYVFTYLLFDIFYLKEPKYTEKYSVKNSTLYKEQL